MNVLQGSTDDLLQDRDKVRFLRDRLSAAAVACWDAQVEKCSIHGDSSSKHHLLLSAACEQRPDLVTASETDPSGADGPPGVGLMRCQPNATALGATSTEVVKRRVSRSGSSLRVSFYTGVGRLRPRRTPQQPKPPDRRRRTSHPLTHCLEASTSAARYRAAPDHDQLLKFGD
ncbi:hypothetical protein [Xanthobacter flavus]|uniref:hypothetical protein n=1 Tax=Xanthobacter flavus TaxID=281 RepID=UPI0037297134